jgi:hypothetical protein
MITIDGTDYPKNEVRRITCDNWDDFIQGVRRTKGLHCTDESFNIAPEFK